MEPTTTLTEPQKRFLTTIFERGAEGASQALSQWLGQPVKLTVSGIDEVDLAEATELLGPAEDLVAACTLELSGALTGLLILAFRDRAGLALADMLLRQPLGTSTEWGELEQSAACETANIVACAYLNSLSNHLPFDRAGGDSSGASEALSPSPPTFRHEFAGSLLEFALMEQALQSERLLLVKTQFAADGAELHWSLVFVPSSASLGALASALSQFSTR